MTDLSPTEVAQQLLAAPLNWTNLTLRELVDAGRIPEIHVPEKLGSMAIAFLNRKHEGQDLDLEEYMNEKKCLIAELEGQFFPAQD